MTAGSETKVSFEGIQGVLSLAAQWRPNHPVLAIAAVCITSRKQLSSESKAARRCAVSSGSTYSVISGYTDAMLIAHILLWYSQLETTEYGAIRCTPLTSSLSGLLLFKKVFASFFLPSY